MLRPSLSPGDSVLCTGKEGKGWGGASRQLWFLWAELFGGCVDGKVDCLSAAEARGAHGVSVLPHIALQASSRLRPAGRRAAC